MNIMNHARCQAVGRRAFVLGSMALTALAALRTRAARAQTQPADIKPWEELVRSIVGDAKPIEGKVAIDIPSIAENGNTVPFSVGVDSPMTDKESIKAIHLISTANPRPQVATFRFTPLSGVARAESRMRLIGTQQVIALAEASDGRFLMGRRLVKVAVGGCGG